MLIFANNGRVPWGRVAMQKWAHWWVIGFALGLRWWRGGGGGGYALNWHHDDFVRSPQTGRFMREPTRPDPVCDKARPFKSEPANQEVIVVSLLRGAKYLGRFAPSEAST